MYDPGLSSVRESKNQTFPQSFRMDVSLSPHRLGSPHCLLFQDQLLCGVGPLQMNRLSLPPLFLGCLAAGKWFSLLSV